MIFLGSSLNKRLRRMRWTIKNMYKNSQRMTYWAIFVSVILAAMSWASIFLYLTFYITYLPKDVMEWDVPLEFRPCKDTFSVCSTPNAVINLLDLRRGTPFTRGQKYQIMLDLEIPESPTNREHGMFMVKVQLRSDKQKGAVIIGTEQRSTILRFKSSLLRSISTVLLSPFMMYGIKEEKQTLAIEFFEDFEESLIDPVTHVFIEVQSKRIELYSATLRIHAKFSGIRYLMYHYPVGSAVVGISIFMNFLTALIVLSLCHFSKVNTNDLKMKIENKRALTKSREILETDEEVTLKETKQLKSLSRASRLRLSSSEIVQASPVKIDTIHSMSQSAPVFNEEIESRKTLVNELDMDFTHISRSRSPSIESIAEDSSCERRTEEMYRKNAEAFATSVPASMSVSGDFDLLSSSNVRQRNFDQVESD